ncbi:MAG: RNA polymerase sigma factor [Dehalococcoidia bacterium]
MDNDFIKEEIALVNRAKEDDREAFGQLMENHAPRAYRTAFTILQNQADAEDVVQEAFITAYKSIKKLEKEGSFGSWLRRIVTTRAYDFLRQKQRQNKAIEASTSQFKLELSQSISGAREATQDCDLDLREAIKKLPEQHRLVVMLRYSKDATTDEIAAALNRPAGTIRRILSESYRLLRLHLEGEKNP